MFRFALPLILIGIAITGFFLFTNPLYKEVIILRDQTISFNEALGNAKSLESERDKLTQKYNAINPDNLYRLQKLLPDNVDNIRLILEIEKIASPYGMILKDIKYDTIPKKEDSLVGEEASVVVGGLEPESRKEYGIWNLEFSTEGSYLNFLNFIKDLENNLRIVDIAEIQFSSDVNEVLGSSKKLSDSYKFDFKIKTYWLKN